MSLNRVNTENSRTVDKIETENKTSSSKNEVKTKSKRELSKEPLLKDQEHKWFFEKYTVVPHRVVMHFAFLAIAVHGIFNFPFLQHYKTVIFAYVVVLYTMFGVTGGIHRLWSHKAFKAKTPLKIILAGGYFLSALVPFRQWIIIHRVHHKYTDTDADPHNSKRGFFFSHFGWLMIKRPREVVEKLPMIDMSDIDADPVVTFCDRYYFPLVILINLTTISMPILLWNESLAISFWAEFLRHIYTTHITLSVNSFAHMFGGKPYDKGIDPVENRIVSWLTGGEGWHNYHHAFPTDYRTSEIGGWRYDLTAELLTLFEKIGWAYDLKKPNDKVVRMTIKNRGDGTLLHALMS